MINFKDFWRMPKNKPSQVKKDPTERRARHMHPIGRDPMSHKKHAGEFVPQYHRPVIENAKLKRIKKGKSKFEILHKKDVQEICDQYGIKPNSMHDKKLGNMGIIMRFDYTKNKFILTRK